MQRIFDAVARFGWHVVAVAPRKDENFIEYAFTVGLFQTHQHSELVVFGLPMKVAHDVLATAVECIEQHLPFEDGQVRSDVLDKYGAAFLAVDRSFYFDYLGSAIGFYDSTDFPVP